MILPAVRERLEALLRHPAMEGALAALRAGGSHVSITGLHDVAKALVAACLTHELRRPVAAPNPWPIRSVSLPGSSRELWVAWPRSPRLTGFPGNRKVPTLIFSNAALLPSFVLWTAKSPW
ncbi:MAG: hypothetical protein AUH86_25165 [Acidobacteria bacterium 13_1_40CM_4_58_4]|nr:MAG: hypothetical protein AUH86_25165 [Acidobacteria bacterium 13_1_40CM_4_58_4]